MTTEELIAQAMSLPPEERALIADSLLKSLSPAEAEMEQNWTKLAKRRLEELRSGAVTPVPGAEVFEKITTRFPS